MKFQTHILACLALSLCATTLQARDEHSSVTIIDDNALESQFEEQIAELVKSEEATPYATLKEQLERKSCKLKLPSPGSAKLSPAQIYQQRIKSTLMLGRLHHCSKKKCKKVHASIASGVVIHEEGVVLTNYHVADGGDVRGNDRTICIGAMTHDGRAFLVEEVLAADEKTDVAILKLKNAEGLNAAPILRDEPVGNPVTIISNPYGKFFSLTQGYISRYHVGSRDAPGMNVTADFATGSSGGPIFNDRGDIVGLVASTLSIPSWLLPLTVDEENGALGVAGGAVEPLLVHDESLSIGIGHQMTLKNSVPSRAILDLVEE